MPLLAVAHYRWPHAGPYLLVPSCYLAAAAAVIAHNHNHSPTFKNRRANAVFANWISIFYGYPTFAWVPTHNLNHHRFVNRAGDATITWRYTDRHNWLVASTYFYVSAYWQSDPIKMYIRKARRDNPALFRTIVTQYVIWAGAHVAALAAACALYGFMGIRVWLLALGVPAFFALWTVMLFNYIQHVHADPWSAHNHSRSFTGKAVNFLLFNNGFHGAHHENAGAHWSKLPALHAAIADRIHPDLKPAHFWPWMFKTYVLGIFFARFRTKQVGRAPFDAPSGEELPRAVATADVDAVDSGVNAVMA